MVSERPTWPLRQHTNFPQSIVFTSCLVELVNFHGCNVFVTNIAMTVGILDFVPKIDANTEKLGEFQGLHSNTLSSSCKFYQCRTEAFEDGILIEASEIYPSQLTLRKGVPL